jgi:ubiquitin-conjugating enzyme E2 Q
MDASSNNSPSRAARNVSIVEGGGVSGTATAESNSSPSSTVGEDGPTAIPADECDPAVVSSRRQQQQAIVDVPAASSVNNNNTDGANDGGVEEEDGVTENDCEEGDDNDDIDEEDNESEYSYTYEDEDETHYSGFLIPTDNPFDNSNTNNEGGVAAAEDAPSSEVNNSHVNSISRTNSRMSSEGGGGPSSSSSTTNNNASSSIVVPETNPQEKEKKQKWKEPTRAAVDMSLRAEKEKTGGKRRLASDLYKIMMADTSEAGFSLEPSNEDSMDKWRIKLFDFDVDSNLAKDLLVCGLDHVELEMSFPDQYPFEPPFVRVVQPRFKRQTGFVMSGALCMELLTKDGWNPVNDIESVIVSIRSIMVIGDGRVQTASEMSKDEYKQALAEATSKSKAKKQGKSEEEDDDMDEEDGNRPSEAKRKRVPSEGEMDPESKSSSSATAKRGTGGSYTASEAKSAYQHLSKYHEKEGWDKSGWWSRKG